MISFAEKTKKMSHYFSHNTHNTYMIKKHNEKVFKNYLKNSKKLIKNTFFAIFLIFFAIFSSIFVNFNDLIYAEDNYIYTDKVEHLFTHCLIAYPEIAFKADNEMRKYYAVDCITSKEFISILNELYNNDYVLVNLNSCFKTENNIAVKQKIKIPKNKKALVLSFDDVNYDHKKMGLGMVDKIIIDDKGNLASLTKFGNKNDIRYDVEFIPILEQFIKMHPDFSINGAKGVLNVTGYDGILGYRTSRRNLITRDEEIKQAQVVVNKLKENGWIFASHSYGHYHMNKIDLLKWKEEVKLWKDEVECLVGETNIYVYPYGEWQVFENGEICDKHKILQEAGFSLFCGVGMQTFYSYLPNKNHKVLFMDRKCVDGSTITAKRSELTPFFNPSNILDSARLL